MRVVLFRIRNHSVYSNFLNTFTHKNNSTHQLVLDLLNVVIYSFPVPCQRIFICYEHAVVKKSTSFI